MVSIFFCKLRLTFKDDEKQTHFPHFISYSPNCFIAKYILFGILLGRSPNTKGAWNKCSNK